MKGHLTAIQNKVDALAPLGVRAVRRLRLPQRLGDHLTNLAKAAEGQQATSTDRLDRELVRVVVRAELRDGLALARASGTFPQAPEGCLLTLQSPCLRSSRGPLFGERGLDCYMSARSPMIDPAIIDVMQQMSRQPPVPTLPVENVANPLTADFAEGIEAVVRQNERYVREWAENAQTAVTALVEKAGKTGFDAESMEALRRSADIADRQTAADANEFERQQKGLRRATKQLKARYRRDADVYEQMAQRFLAANARMGAIRFELGLAVKAALAKVDPENQAGPTFDDPDEIERHLLAAGA